MTHAPAFQHITVPVDGSTTAERGVAFALELARGGGVITFCSVIDASLVCAPVGHGVAVDLTPLLNVLEADAAEFCRHAQGEAVREGIESHIQVLHGRCAATIEALVRRNGSQAIVIGTHGRTGLARTVLGSVAEELIRCSDVPVVAVHEDDVMRTGPITVALDESPAAHAALEIAIRIGTTRGIPLVLVHGHDARLGNRDRASALLDAAAKRARVLGADVKTVVREGHAHDALLKTADELECCMIVVGTHGRPFFDRLVLGSVAAHVVQHARVPVVTVRRTQPS